MAVASKAELWIGGVVMAAGVILILSAPGILLYQAVLWLRDGFWTPLPCRVLWYALGGGEPSISWLGVQRLALGALEAPLSLGVFLVGCLAAWLGAKLGQSS